ncbi:fumarylacetoacetate hydrolase family protein [Chelativorans sp. J32]|uniref:fumarylacetoacetate hydrolase family protein n=1 Tax=Chelativorans sp. J32 TaxID=935840 RepID=UPI000481EFBD|nr:fumarylacetoacetate hydrolase family protein [Chelativorans sp. J32]
MVEFVIPAPEVPSVAVAGHVGRFPVRRIFCVGRNYAAHAREMGHDPDREDPFFFTKPADAVVDSGATIPYPPLTSDLHHEIELVAAIGKGGNDIPVEAALAHVWGYAVGIDLTRRDLQAEAKKAARPWDWAKGFDNSAPCGPLRPVESIGHPAKGRIWLSVDNETRQDADLSDLIWPVANVIAFCSKAVRLEPGDLIFTGTPEGVGRVDPGQQITGGIEGLGEISIQVGKR